MKTEVRQNNSRKTKNITLNEAEILKWRPPAALLIVLCYSFGFMSSFDFLKVVGNPGFSLWCRHGGGGLPHKTSIPIKNPPPMLFQINKHHFIPLLFVGYRGDPRSKLRF